MANTYYDSQLTAQEIEAALEAIDGVIVPANNGKVLAINNGKLEARSVQWGGGEAVLEPLSVTANGDYTPEAGVDGFDEVHVSVPNSYTASDEGKVVNNGTLVAQTARASQITQNGTYDTTLNDEVTVNVSGGGSAVVQPLSVTQNGTYNPPSGVDGYAPVTVNVQGGSSDPSLPSEYQEVEYLEDDGNSWFVINVACNSNDIVRCWTMLYQIQSTESGFAGTEVSGWDLYYTSSQILSYYVGVDFLGTRSASTNVKYESYVQLDRTKSYFLWGRYRPDNYPFIGRLYKFYLFRAVSDAPSNSAMRTMCALIPCYRKADNVVGVYDVINNAFYTNQGSGTFTAGPDVN